MKFSIESIAGYVATLCFIGFFVIFIAVSYIGDVSDSVGVTMFWLMFFFAVSLVTKMLCWLIRKLKKNDTVQNGGI